jgi:hypothetical protein
MRKISLIILIMLAEISSVQAGVWWVDGHLVINDGDVYDGEVFIIEHGSVDMFGGIVGKLETWDYSTGNIYGGELDWLFADDSSVINICGGALHWLGAFGDSSINVYAYNVTYHLTGGLEDRPWLEGTYCSDNSSFSFTLYDEYTYSHINLICCSVLDAQIDIHPASLNLAAKGKWITCHMWLPEDYNVAEIDAETVRLQRSIRPAWAWFNEDKHLAMFRFSRSEVAAILEPGYVELTVGANLVNGTYFEGRDIIKVIDKAHKKD